MKKLAIIFLVFPFLGYSQDQRLSIDSLKREILNINANQENLTIAITKANEEFYIGSMVVVGGLVLTGLDLFVWSKEKDINGKPYKNNGKYIGFGLVTVGTFIQIDSFKWIQRLKKKKRNSLYLN